MMLYENNGQETRHVAGTGNDDATVRSVRTQNYLFDLSRTSIGILIKKAINLQTTKSIVQYRIQN